ncbi:MAG: ABC transporter permease [Ktedonobacteraceae bacterium]
MHAITYDLRVIWACMKKDIKSALSERVATIITILVPINLLILMSLFVISGGLAPTAVVMNDQGPYARQFYTAMSQAHSFSLRITNASDAEQLIQAGKIVAIVTIPADFDARIQQNQPVQVDVKINNLNTDFTNDIRRAVPLSITSFYAKAFPNLVTVTPHELDLQPHDTGYIPYLTFSILVIGLMLGGLLQSGGAAAHEWENATIKELLLSPASRWAILTGKLLGAFAISAISVVLLLLVMLLVFQVWPVNWGEVIGFMLLTLIIFLALGVLLGTLLKSRMPVIALSIGLSIPLFFLSGAFGPISFNTPAIQVLAKIFPVYYAIVLQQHAFHNFDLNTYGTGVNALILCGYAVGTIILASIVLRRSAVTH